MREYCWWCNTPVKVNKRHNFTNVTVCSKGCRDAWIMFERWMSDEEINRRDHYDQLTGGDDEVD